MKPLPFYLPACLWRVNRLIARFRAWRCKRAGMHTTSRADWGYGMKGMVDLFCSNCGQIVRTVPLDDAEQMMDVLEAVREARRLEP